MLGSLANGNDADFFASLGVGHRHHLVFQKAQGQKSTFAIVFAVIFGRQREAAKDLLGIGKVDAVLSQVSPTLRFVPGEQSAL
jgi:hypothetical protein